MTTYVTFCNRYKYHVANIISIMLKISELSILKTHFFLALLVNRTS